MRPNVSSLCIRWPRPARPLRRACAKCWGSVILQRVRWLCSAEQRWERDDLIGEEISWSVGFGPRTHAYVIKPAQATEPLPGIVALHDHSDYKFYGKEKIADGPTGAAPGLNVLRELEYGGRSVVAALARAGFVVMAHDCFLWGSRRFPLETMIAAIGDHAPEASPFTDAPPDIEHYNTIAALHEHRVAKYCNALGTSLAGVVS